MNARTTFLLVVTVGQTMVVPHIAFAYIGPGAGASLAGSLLGITFAVFTAVAVVLFWPLRLIYRRLRDVHKAAASQAPDASTERGRPD